MVEGEYVAVGISVLLGSVVDFDSDDDDDDDGSDEDDVDIDDA